MATPLAKAGSPLGGFRYGHAVYLSPDLAHLDGALRLASPGEDDHIDFAAVIQETRRRDTEEQAPEERPDSRQLRLF